MPSLSQTLRQALILFNNDVNPVNTCYCLPGIGEETRASGRETGGLQSPGKAQSDPHPDVTKPEAQTLSVTGNISASKLPNSVHSK